ncbi:hypothetical protein F5144DRAFT_574138 [Chaetomium tenue]|uniref:Uncharacterized protein n=1 Tax=Chaetomium tenue TaxID=1854479 RepID=A0ACB7P828_9PEZI|nr:hypothetical protein F5144DRAFT_574138 [Chaetomium globosum]
MEFTPRLQRGSQSFTLPLNEHRVHIRVCVSEFHLKGKPCLKSHIQCVPCCNDAPSAEELSKIIDDLHIEAFGVGGWIYTGCDYLPSSEGGVSCEEKSQNALSVLPTSGDGLEARLKEWKQKSEALLKSMGSIRQLKEEEAALQRDLEHAAALNKHHPPKRRRKGGNGPEKIVPPSGAENLLRDMNDTMLVYNFITQVKKGVIALNLPSGRNSTAEVCFDEFVAYRLRQQSQADDNGEEFERTLKKVAKAENSRAKCKSTTVFVCRFLSHLVQHLHRQRDPKYSETGNLDSEKRVKKTESVAVMICKIVNGLHEHKGVEALVVLNALVERRYKASRIRDISQERQDAFVSSVIDLLVSVDLSVPSHTRLFHPAAFVYWALSAMKLKFATVCGLLELKALSAYDPSLKLDALAEGWLNSNIPFAMTIPLSECQNIKVENKPRRASDDERSSPRVGADQCSSPGSRAQYEAGRVCEGSPGWVSAAAEAPPPYLLADVARRDPTPGAHGTQSPGVDRAGDAPGTIAPAPHNSPAGRSQADPLFHGQGAAAAATRTSWDTLDFVVQEPSPYEATIGGPQDCNARAQTQEVPSKFKLLLAAAGLRDTAIGEERASAIPGQERDQRTGTAPAGLPPRAADLYSIGDKRKPR